MPGEQSKKKTLETEEHNRVCLVMCSMAGGVQYGWWCAVWLVVFSMAGGVQYG